MKQFRKLKVASAVSMAIFASQTQATVQLENDVQLSGETYAEALQWTPGGDGYSLELNNVTVDAASQGQTGVYILNANKNGVSISDSDIKGGVSGYGLRFRYVTDSNIHVENSTLSANGGSPYIYSSDSLTNSTLTLKDSSLSEGSRGIHVEKAEDKSVITLDNTKVSDMATVGLQVGTLNNSSVNILNNSEISSVKNGVTLTNIQNSDINVDSSTLTAGSDGVTKSGAGLLISSAEKSDIAITNSTLSGGLNGYAVKVTSATDSNILLEKSNLGAVESNAWIYSSDNLTNSGLTLNESILTGGQRVVSIVNMNNSNLNLNNSSLSESNDRGIYVGKADENSVITLDNTIVSDMATVGLRVDTLNNSSVNILNNSKISSVKNGVTLTNIQNSDVNVDSSTLIAGSDGVTKSGAGLLISSADKSDIAITNSTLSGGFNGFAVRIADATDSKILLEKNHLGAVESNAWLYSGDNLTNSELILKESTLTGGQRGVSILNMDNSTLNFDNSSLTAGSGSRGLSVDTLTDSVLNIINGADVTAVGTGVYVGAAENGTINISDSHIKSGVNEGNLGQYIGVQVTGNNSVINVDRSTILAGNASTTSGSSGSMGLRVLGSDNSIININNSKISGLDQEGAFASLYLQETNNSVANIKDSDLQGTVLIRSSNNNVVNITGSNVNGGLDFYYNTSEVGQPHHNNIVNFDSSYIEGRIWHYVLGSGSENVVLEKMDTQVNFSNGSTWKAAKESNVENISVTDSTVDIQDATLIADNWYSDNANVLVNSQSLLNIDTGNGNMNMVIKSDGKELETTNKQILNVNNGSMDVTADDVDIGAYKYQLVNNAGQWTLVLAGTSQPEPETPQPEPETPQPEPETPQPEPETPQPEPETPQPEPETPQPEPETPQPEPETPQPEQPGGGAVLSNSANAVLSSLAAAQTSWNSQTTTIYNRLKAGMTKDEGEVWGAYYGNEWAGKAGLSSTFNQKINGFAIGADRTLALRNAQLTLGAAAMRDYSHLSGFDEKGSGGAMYSTAIQAYGYLSMDNGLFFKGTASAGRADSNLHARSSDGALAKGDYKQHLFGLTGQTGYRYQITEEVYVAPFAQMNGFTASSAKFSLDNGMKVNSDRYWSARGELGVEAGMQISPGGFTLNPHITAAGGHEFVKNNYVHLNGLSNGFNNTVDGSGYRIGAGVDAQLTKSLSAGVNVNYSQGRDVEQRYGINAGVSLSF